MTRRSVAMAVAALLLVSACGGGKTVKDTRTPEEIKAGLEAMVAEAMAMGPQPQEPLGKVDENKKEEVKAVVPVPLAPPPPPPKTPLELLAEAKTDRQAGRSGEALTKAIEARKSLPDSAVASELVARLLYETGRDDDAFASLEEMMAKGQGGQDAVDTYVELAARSGKYRRAAEVLEKRTASTPNAETTGAIGWLLFMEGDSARALVAFASIEATPVYQRYAIFAARLKLVSGELSAARDVTGKASGSGEAAALVLADAERGEGHAAAAEEGYKSILKRSPGDYAAKVNLGVLKLGQGENKAASELFESALKTRPDQPEAANNLGLAKRALGDHAGAEKAYASALAVTPDYPPALKNLAILLEKYLGRPAEAIPLYEKYLKKMPGDKDVDRYLKAAQRAAQDLQRAQDAAAQQQQGGQQAAPSQAEGEKK